MVHYFNTSRRRRNPTLSIWKNNIWLTTFIVTTKGAMQMCLQIQYWKEFPGVLKNMHTKRRWPCDKKYVDTYSIFISKRFSHFQHISLCMCSKFYQFQCCLLRIKRSSHHEQVQCFRDEHVKQSVTGSVCLNNVVCKGVQYVGLLVEVWTLGCCNRRHFDRSF